MSPDVAIDRVRSFLRWNGDRFDALDEEHAPIADPVGWRRGQGERLEYWIKPKTWQGIFDNDESAALTARQMLKEARLLRVQDRDRCQAVVALAPNGARPTRAYVVRGRILDWRPSAYVAPKQQVTPLPVMPDDFSELTPEEKQNFLLSSAMKALRKPSVSLRRRLGRRRRPVMTAVTQPVDAGACRLAMRF